MEQYGGGSNVFKKKTKFPTKKEMNFFRKFTELSSEPKLKRRNAAYVALNPMKMRFIGIDSMTNTYKIQHHVTRLIDIFIRKMIKQADGNLRGSKETRRGFVKKKNDSPKKKRGWPKNKRR
ncbi:hypothetical protein B9Z55_011025 [Caenorhabditis nigoni]|uniref:Uncharacterized protein n=1 Tax=Caenorhabditis nigoni TaxID=1611254 RepID=A0A2G5UIF7_9PELO|nr:hypothetical protein B9Z55_011025 [Caenorhabditis nigoni]